MEQPPALSEAPPPAAQSLAGRLMNVFAAPGEVFEEIKVAPVRAANWLVPALLIIAVSWIGAALIFSQESFRHQVNEIADKSIQKAIDQNHMTGEQADKARQMGEKFGYVATVVGGVVGPLIAAFFIPFFWGLIIWLAGSKIHKGGFSYMKGVEAAGLAAIITALESVVRVLLVFGMGSLLATPSAALLVKDYDPQQPAHAAMGALNVMTIWVLIVRSIGLARLGSISLAKAAAWVFGIWVAYTGVSVGYLAAMQALAQAARHH